MSIFAKRKFSKITEHFYDHSMKNVIEMNELLTSYQAKSFIEMDVDKFVLVTSLYFFFLQECALHKKYPHQHSKDVVRVKIEMIFTISNRLGYDTVKILDVYESLKKTLLDMAYDKKCTELGVYVALAVHYLQAAFSGQYNPEEFGIDDCRVESAISNLFSKAAQENREYLG